MKKLMVMTGLVTLLVAFAAPEAFAQFNQDQGYDVRARIPEQNGFSVAINRIQGSTWSTRSSVDFGTLYFDNTNNIFLSNYIYAVDVGVTANLPNWSIKHTRTSLLNAGSGEDLDDNLNVSFVKQVTSMVDEPLEKVTYGNSNNKIFTKAQLNDGEAWLRIYYGLATGDTNNDAPGAEPITINKPAGTYTGEVTITVYETL